MELIPRLISQLSKHIYVTAHWFLFLSLHTNDKQNGSFNHQFEFSNLWHVSVEVMHGVNCYVSRLEKERNQLQLECEDLLSSLDSVERNKVTH